MLNAQGERMLAYIAQVTDIQPIEGADNIVLGHVGGWPIIIKREEFNEGDKCVFFEIDSLVPATETFEFLAKRNYKVKTLKLNKFGVYSQGLAIPLSEFNLPADIELNTDMTQKLGVKYYVAADNERKAKVDPKAKYRAMASRHAKLFKKPFFRWMMRRDWGRKILYMFFGRKKDKSNAWPSHICSKTDVERVQNMTWVLKDKNPYVATEKVDGSSSTFVVERKGRKLKYYVCSRNVVFLDEKQDCYYDTNIYFEAYNKYNMRDILTKILNDYNLPNLAIQAEVFGANVQKRDYSLKNKREIRVFHMVSNGVKFPMDKTVEICEKYGLPHVHIVDDNYILPDTIDELQQFTEGEGSAIDGGPREGIVFYDKATGQTYFKFVSPEFLMKYHGKD